MFNQSIVVVDQLWSDEEEVSSVGPGENVKIKLKGIEEEDISSGFVLCDPNNACKTGRTFDAQVRSQKAVKGVNTSFHSLPWLCNASDGYSKKKLLFKIIASDKIYALLLNNTLN